MADSDFIDSLVARGDECSERGDWASAVVAYQAALGHDRSQAYVHFQLGNALFELGRKDEAVTAFSECSHLAPRQFAPAFNLGNALYDLERYREAAAAFLNAAERDPTNAEAPYNLGRTFAAIDHPADAARAYLQAATIDPTHRRAISNLARTLFDMGARPDAVPWQERAVQLAPEIPEEWFSLGQMLSTTGRLPQAIAAFEKTIELEPAATTAYEAAGQCLHELGRRDELLRLAEDWLTACPGDPRAIHLSQAWRGESPTRAADGYVRSLFDEFAPDFDKQLARLEYRAPELLAKLLEEFPPTAAVAERTVLDAGCGTGLCGPLLRPQAGTLIGVDLSCGMVAEARKRKVYDDLVVGELTEYLARQSSRFDAIISADTLVYFGDLTRVFAAAAGALRTGGRFLFSLEACSADVSATGWLLTPSGRYSHSEAFVRESLIAAGFDIFCVQSETMRKERGEPAPGWLVAAGLRPRG